MCDRDAVIIKDIDRIAGSALFVFLFTAAICGDAGDKYAADLKFARAVNNMLLTLHRIGIIMTRRIVTDRNNIRFQFQCIVTNGFIVKRIGHHCCIIALGEPKAGMSVPGNFHEVQPPRGIIMDKPTQNINRQRTHHGFLKVKIF